MNDAQNNVMEAYQRRGILGVLMLIVPIVAIFAVGIAYFVLMAYGLQGRGADGPVLRLTYDGCAEAEPFLRARAEQMGLPALEVAVEGSSVVVTAQVPERSREAIPATLAKPGQVELRAVGGEVLATRDDVQSAVVSLGMLTALSAQVGLKPDAAIRLENHQKAHLDGAIELLLDGELVRRQENLPPVEQGWITLDWEGASDKEKLDRAAEAALVIEHGPLPCDVVLASVEDVP